MNGHEVAAIDVGPDGYVIECACGWAGGPLPTRTELLDEWSVHLEHVPSLER